MVSLSMEQEPMLPTIASEKAPMDVDTFTFAPIRPTNTKMNMFKKLLVAVSLMLMGASILKIAQGHSHSHHHHHHLHHQFGALKDFEHHDDHGPHPHAPPHGFPGRHGPHPAGPPRPRPVDCFALEDGKAVDFNMTLRGFVQNIFLDRSLGGASVDIERSFDEKLDRENNLEAPPHDGPRRGPPPPGPPPHGPKGPDGPHPHPHPHGKSSTVQVSVKTLSSDNTAKTNKTFVCSLALPCGKKGLGLFNEDISKHNKELENNFIELKEPKSFEPVSIKLTIPEGPFSLTHGPPERHFRGPPHRPHHFQGPRKGVISVINFFKGKKPCSGKAAKRIAQV